MWWGIFGSTFCVPPNELIVTELEAYCAPALKIGAPATVVGVSVVHVTAARVLVPVTPSVPPTVALLEVASVVHVTAAIADVPADTVNPFEKSAIYYATGSPEKLAVALIVWPLIVLLTAKVPVTVELPVIVAPPAETVIPPVVTVIPVLATT